MEKSTSNLPGEYLEDITRSFFYRILDRIFGFDFFISYAWVDGREYAKNLYDILKREGFECFLDSKNYYAGDNLTAAAKRAINKSRNLILVGTPLSPTRPAILEELELFTAKKRRIIPINLGGCIRPLSTSSPFFKYIDDSVLRIEVAPHLHRSAPNEYTIREIKRLFDGIRQTQIRLRYAIILAFVFAILSILAVAFAVDARVETFHAKLQLANTSWLIAQSSQQSSPITSAHYFLRCAETLSSIGDTSDSNDALLAARQDSDLIQHSWSLNRPIEGCTISPNGSKFLTWNRGGQVRIIGLANSYPSEVLSNSKSILKAIFNRDGSEILTWGNDGTIQISKLPSKSPLVFKHVGAVNGAEFVLGDSQILSWSCDDTAALWNKTTSEPPKIFRHSNTAATLDMSFGFVQAQQRNQNEVSAAAISKDGSLLITVGTDATARLWNVSNGVPIFTFRSSGAMKGAKFNAFGDYVMCWGDGGLVWFQDRPAKQPIVAQTFDSAMVRGAEFDKRQKRVLSWDDGGTINLRNFPGGQTLKCFQQNGTVDDAIFLDDESEILSWSEVGSATLWSVSDGKQIRDFQHGGPITGAIVNSDGSLLMTYGSDGNARVWNISDGKLLQTYRHQGPVRGALFVPESSEVLTWGDDEVIRLWNLETNDQFHIYAQKNPIEGARLISDGSKFLTWDVNGLVQLFNVNNPQPERILKQGKDFAGVTMSASGSNVISWGSDGIIKVWPLNGKVDHKDFSLDDGVSGVSTSENDTFLLAWIQNGYGTVWDVKNSNKVNQINGKIAGASFAPKGGNFLTWDSSGVINVWHAGETQPLMTGSHDDIILGAKWRQDATQFVTWSVDGTAKIWSLDKAQPIQILRHAKTVKDAIFSPDGNFILTWGLDNKAKLWRLGQANPVKEINVEEPLRGAVLQGEDNNIWTWCDDGTLQLLTWRGPAKIFKNDSPIVGIQVDKDGNHFMTLAADHRIRFWTIKRSEPICTFSQLSQFQGADMESFETGILTWNESGDVNLCNLPLNTSGSVEQNILEFEIRSSTTLGPDGQVRALSMQELQNRQMLLAKMTSK